MIIVLGLFVTGLYKVFIFPIYEVLKYLIEFIDKLI